MEGKVVLVAGGTGALGAELCLHFARKRCTVYATTRGRRATVDQQDPLWNSIHFITADVAVEGNVLNLFDRIMSECSRIDVVINATGGYLPKKPLTDVSLADWERMMESNLKTTFLLTREAVRRMNGQSYGRIINISAMTGLRPTPGYIPYALSKHSVSLLTELAAQEVAGSSITINAIAPGVIATGTGGDTSEATARSVVSPSTIADVIDYLCSTAANVINSTTIRLPGGS
jgi:NAD(P)-dependent dehydrogenase (short-subunit alcohol dehydrogenase family)